MSYSWQSKRWQRLARTYGGTTVLCVAIALTLWLLDLSSPLWATFVISFCIGYSVTTAAVFLDPLIERFSPIVQALITTAIGVGTGLLLAGYLVTGQIEFFLTDDDYSAPVLGLFFGLLGFSFFRTQQRLKEAQLKLEKAEAERLAHDKEHLETQLKLLQAQIEPHFLFNTLSNVIGMIKDQPEAAEQTLLNLTTLLRASLRRSRDPVTRLGDELEILEALLKINQIRMGSRLRYDIALDPPLRDTPLPPMLLQPLVENAIKHGIEPLEEGGTLAISAIVEDSRLIVRIADTGRGICEPDAPANGTGTGISNVQSRLNALFGSSASLTLTENSPRGMIATLAIPITNS